MHQRQAQLHGAVTGGLGARRTVPAMSPIFILKLRTQRWLLKWVPACYDDIPQPTVHHTILLEDAMPLLIFTQSLFQATEEMRSLTCTNQQRWCTVGPL